jgi:hypothetical protein
MVIGSIIGIMVDYINKEVIKMGKRMVYGKSISKMVSFGMRGKGIMVNI